MAFFLSGSLEAACRSICRVLASGCLAALVLAAAPACMPHQAAFAQAGATTVAYSVGLMARASGASLSLELSDEVGYEVTLLSRPDRIVIDLPKVVFATTPQKPGGKIGPVSAYRYGLFFADRSRVVIDLAEPAVIDRVDSTGSDGRRRLVFHLARIDRAKFNDAVASAARTKVAGDAPETTGRIAAVDPATRNLPLIVLDPGHGGIDPGAIAGGGETEKGIVLPLAIAVKERLEKAGRVRVAMTRSGDNFVSLSDRVKFARDQKAALMVSLHADTVAFEPGVRGASIYTLSEKASDVISARLADSENRVDQLAGVETREDTSAIDDILFDLTKRETRHFSIGLARHLAGTMTHSTSMHKNPLRAAGFRVLTAPDVPSVLIETGYLSSAEDAKQMKSIEWRTAMADAIGAAVEKFVGENATRVTNSAAKP